MVAFDAVGELAAQPGGQELSALVDRVQRVDPEVLHGMGRRLGSLVEGVDGSLAALGRHGEEVRGAWQGRGAEALTDYLAEFGRAGTSTLDVTGRVRARIDGAGQVLDGMRREVDVQVSRALDGARRARAEALADPARAAMADHLAARAMAGPTAAARVAVERAETALGDAATVLQELAGEVTAFSRLPAPDARPIAPPPGAGPLGWSAVTPVAAESVATLPALVDTGGGSGTGTGTDLPRGGGSSDAGTSSLDGSSDGSSPSGGSASNSGTSSVGHASDSGSSVDGSSEGCSEPDPGSATVEAGPGDPDADAAESGAPGVDDPGPGSSEATGSEATGTDATGSDGDATGADATGSDGDATGADATGADAAGGDATDADPTESEATGSDAGASDPGASAGDDSGSGSAGGAGSSDATGSSEAADDGASASSDARGGGADDDSTDTDTDSDTDTGTGTEDGAVTGASTDAAVDPGAEGGEGAAPTGGPQGQVGDWIREAMGVLQAEGVPLDKMDPDDIATIIEHESGGNPDATNNWDSNADKGTPSQGLMQTIGPTFDSYKLEGHGEITDPIDNIIAGVRYAIDRYGSVSQVPGVEAVGRGDAYVGY